MLLRLNLRRWARTWTAWLVLGCALTACSRTPIKNDFDPADPHAYAAALREQLQRDPSDASARRELAHIEWIWLGNPHSAQAHLDRLVRGGDPAALLSRLLMARARRDSAKTAELGYALLERAVARKDPEDPLLVAASEVAARALQQSHGDRPDDDRRFTSFYGQHEAALRRLPFSVRQPLMSLRAAIARRRGEPYRQLFAEQGCVQVWESSPVWGRLGDYELEAQGSRSFELDPTAHVVPLSCVVRVWNPTERSGIRKLRTTLQTRSDTIVLDVSGQESLRVWIDGEPIHRTDITDRYPARRYRVSVPVHPGAHVLEVATTVNRDHSWVLVRAVDGDGQALAAAADGATAGAGVRGPVRLRRPSWLRPSRTDGPLQGPLYQPLRAYLAVDAALADGDTDAAEQHLADLQPAQAFAEGWLIAAAFERSDRSRPPTSSAAREQSALEQALALEPRLDGARILLLELLLRRGDDTEATAMLEGLPEDALRSVAGELLRYRIHRARGRDHLALAALNRAKALDPAHCRVLRVERARARDIDDVRREDAVTEALRHCAGSLETRAKLAAARSNREEAAALWTRILERKPDDIEALESLAKLASVRGDVATAEQRLARVLELVPRRIGAHVARVDLALSQGRVEDARQRLDRALQMAPFSNRLRTLATNLGRADDLLEYRVNGLAALRAYLASGRSYEGAAEALVLDRSVVRVYEGGGLRQIVHIVAQLLSKEALDRYGEIDVPPDARLLTLRSIKPTGQIFEPEQVPGKDGVSLRHLEVGDFVESEYILEQPPSQVVPGYADVSTFRFQSFDVPYHRSELLVLHPPATQLRFDPRNEPPAAETRAVEHGGVPLTLLRFAADQVPRLGVEPGARSVLEEVPNVHVYTPVEVEPWLRSLAASMYFARRTNPQLRRKVKELTDGHDTAAEKLAALWGWVVENIEDGGDLSSGATSTFATRRGNRMILLAAMLDQAGIGSELLLARNRHGPSPLPGGHPLLETYDAALLSVPQEGRDVPLMVMTASKVMPLGYLPPGYDGTTAVRIPVRPGDAAGLVEVPAPTLELADRRVWELDVEVDARGEATVTGTVTLYGGEAIAWRKALREVDDNRVREVFEQAELRWLPGSELVDLDVVGEQALEEPLQLQFDAQTAALGVVQNGALQIKADFLPLNPGANYAALPSRVTGLVVPYAPLHEATVRVRARDGTLSTLPRSTRIESEFGSFERSVTPREGGAEVELRYRSVLRTGVVEAHQYPQFSAFAREVDAATEQSLRVVSNRPEVGPAQ